MALRMCVVLLAVVALASCRPTYGSSRLLRASGSNSSSSGPANLWQLISNSSSSGNLSILKQLVQSAGLVNQLNSSARTATMFLPNDDAWNEYMQETGHNLTQLSQQASLPAQLLYHLHTGSIVKLNDIQPGTRIAMANGVNVTGDLSYDDITELRDAAGRVSEIMQQDIPAGSNATAHIVTRVLVPWRPATLEQALLNNTSYSSYLKAMYAGGYNATLNSTNTNMTFFVPTNDAFDEALAILNLTFSALLDNHTLLTSILSAHILPTVERWESLLAYSGMQYFFTCNNCATFYSEEADNGQVEILGVGSVVASMAMIEEDNLIAGQYALMHTIDSVLLPLAKWGSRCTYRCQSPGDTPPPQRK